MRFRSHNNIYSKVFSQCDIGHFVKRSENSLHCWTQQGHVREWPYISCPLHLTSPFSSPSTNLPLAVDHILWSEGDILYPCSHCSDCTLCADCLNTVSFPWQAERKFLSFCSIADGYDQTHRSGTSQQYSDVLVYTTPISHDSGVYTVMLVLHLVAIRLYCNWKSCSCSLLCDLNLQLSLIKHLNCMNTIYCSSWNIKFCPYIKVSGKCVYFFPWHNKNESTLVRLMNVHFTNKEKCDSSFCEVTNWQCVLYRFGKWKQPFEFLL